MVSSVSANETQAEMMSSLSENELCDDQVPATSVQPGCDCDGCVLGSRGPVVYQPKQATILSKFKAKGRSFLPAWFDQYKWLTLCTTKGKHFGLTVDMPRQRDYLLSPHEESQLSLKKGLATIRKVWRNSISMSHPPHNREAVLKCTAVASPSIQCLMNTKLCKQQQIRRAGLLKQISAIRFLLRQGLALRGHKDTEGNLYQLLLT